MNIVLNGKPYVFTGSTLMELIEQMQIEPPFAAAVNIAFVPKTAYRATALRENDCVDIVRPVVGG